MGNAPTLKRPAGFGIWISEPEPEPVQEDLLSRLSNLQEVDLWRVHWGLSQDLLQDFPPIPPRWLRSADAYRTAKTLQRCYHDDGAQTLLDHVLTLIRPDDQVHQKSDLPRPRLDLPRPRPVPEPELNFVRTQRRRLISRIQRADRVSDILQDCRILDVANRDAIEVYADRKDKNRALVDLVLMKGDKAQEVFYEALSQSEPFLMEELVEEPITEQDPSETSVLAETLESLVSDELRSFHWLVRDHMTEKSRSPIGGEQLLHTDRQTTQRLLKKYFGPKQAETVAMSILQKIVPALSACPLGEAVTSQRSSDIKVETNANTTVVEIKPEVFEDGDMFRLRCLQPSVSRCSVTGLLLEGVGDVVYQMVPWDVDFLSSKGVRPAGPLIRFHLLTGRFHRLHLPHCQLISDGAQSFLSVAHVTGDSVDFITPGQVTDSHVIVDISSFSCFGLVMPAESADQRLAATISGLVLVFFQPSKRSLFVLLLPRNVCLTQVIKEWKRRNGAEYVETTADCELIPNQTYRLSGRPVSLIEPESSKFVNFNDYNNFLASFHVQLEDDVSMVELQLSHRTPLPLIGWLFGSTESVVWRQGVQLRAAVSTVRPEDSVDVSHLLLETLNSLLAEDLRRFHGFLALHSDPIPVCRLEAADRTRTVDLMVQQYHPDGAKDVTEQILRMMKCNQLADHLIRK